MNGPRWIKQWIADLALLNEQFRNDDGSVDFEALGREEYMFRTALITQRLEKSERARDTYAKAKAAYDASSENGKKGGRPRKDATTPDTISTDDNALREGDTGPVDSMGRTDAPSRTLPLPTTEQLYDFARAENLDEADAREWYEMTVIERAGKDRYGKPIGNWKVTCRRFCEAKAKKRSTQK